MDIADDDGKESESLNILIVGAGDCRHIIKTIAQRKRHKHKKIHVGIWLLMESSITLGSVLFFETYFDSLQIIIPLDFVN